MHRCFLIVFVATLSLMASAEARAAHISCEALDERFRPAYQNIYGIPGQNDKSCYSIHVTGEITKGDFDAFRDILRKEEPYVDTVTLISFGGDVNESLKIGKLIRERMLFTGTAIQVDGTTHALISPGNIQLKCRGEQCICASACFFIWAAGISRSGDSLLVHRPRDATGTFGKKSAFKATNEYSALLTAIATYLQQMEVPTKVIDMMQSTASNEMLSLPRRDVKEHLSGYTPGIYEWLVADCGAVSSEEENDYLNGVISYDTLDERGSRYFKLLADKYKSVKNCYLRKIMRERVRLAKESPL